MFTLPCTAHALDLALEQISNLPYFTDQVSDAKTVIRIMTDDQFLTTLFKMHSQLSLLKPGDTCSSTQYIAVRRLLHCKGAVQKLVVSSGFAAWKAKPVHTDQAQQLSQSVVDANFWAVLACFCTLLKPIVRLIRLVDSNRPNMGKVPTCNTPCIAIAVHDICFALQRKLNANQHCTSRLVLQVYPECCEIEKHIQKVTLPEQVKKDVAHIFRERWNSMHSKLHSVGYMLEPQVQGTDFSVEVRLLLPE